MDFLEIAQNRYTTKKYDASKKLEEQLIDKLKEIIRLSPSSINSQPWKIIFANGSLKERLADASYWNIQKINDASQLVVFSVIDNISEFETISASHMNDGNLSYYRDFVKLKGDAEVKNWLKQQVYLSLGFFLAACASLGIDSTPMEGIENEKYDQILNLKNHKTLFAVAIGYRDKEDINQPNITLKTRLLNENVIE